MERLRWVAAMDPSRVDALAREAASALMGCAAHPAEMVVAARRLLDRHPAAGPLWWVASRALTTADPVAALAEALDELEADPTGALIEAQRASRSDVVIVEAWSYGRDGAFVAIGGKRMAQAARRRRRTVLVGGGVGRALPDPVWDVVVARVEGSEPEGPALLSWDDVDAVIGPDGSMSPAQGLATSTCPVARELLGSRSAREFGHGA